MTDIIFLGAWLLFLAAMLYLWKKDSDRINDILDRSERRIEQAEREERELWDER